MKKLSAILLILISYQSLFAQSETEEIDLIAYQAELDSVEATFNYRYGTIELDNGIATLNVPEGYKFLGAEQSEMVLTELWGNPPSEVLGLLFPEDISPVDYDNFTYAVEITYSPEGYVDDEDAEDIDYDELLEQMQEEANDSNEARIAEGYGAIELVGWASEPFYDKTNKKLHWAKEIKFDNAEVNTLNYNIRVLGRKGFINMNAIGDIDVLPLFNEDSSVTFNEGNKYSDFDPGLDDVAAYGIGGLIAGKVLAKAGFFALILKFWKFIAIGAVGLFGAFRKKIFGSKEAES